MSVGAAAPTTPTSRSTPQARSRFARSAGIAIRSANCPCSWCRAPAARANPPSARRCSGSLTEVVLLDADILWQAEFNTPADNYRAFFETWLRVCKNISQAGRPVVLFGAGMGVPSNLEQLHRATLLQHAALPGADLRRRGAGRATAPAPGLAANGLRRISGRARALQPLVQDAGCTQPDSQIETIDTTCASLEESAAQVAAWIRGKLVNGKW
jgi:hypothetical protein